VGYGVPGLPGELAGVDGALAVRLTYALFCAAATVLLYVFAARRAGALVALAVSLAALPSLVPRYAMGWAAILGCALLVERAARRSGARSLAEVAARAPRGLLAASVILSLAAWARVEYAAFSVVWAGVLVAALPAPARRRQAAAAVALAALPSLPVLAGGHLADFADYLAYSALDFREYRGIDADWSFPADWLTDLAHGRTGTTAAGLMAFYGVMALLIAAWIAHLTTGCRLLARDPLRLAPLLGLLGALVLYSNTVRFGVDYSLAAAPLGWAAVVAATGRSRVGRAVIVAAALVLAVQVSGAYTPWALRDALAHPPDQSLREPVERLGHLPINAADWPSLAALPVLWRERIEDRSHVLSVTRRNDVAVANDVIVYPLLDARPAAWPVTYDPGLVTRRDVQVRAVAELCRHRAPVVQLDGDYPPVNGREARRPGSRRLDQVIAASHRLEAVAGFYRLLVLEGPGCVLPEHLDEAARRARRDLLVERDDLPGAGALAVLGLERGGRDPDDVALAVLGGYAIDPALLGLDAALRSLATGATVPGTLPAAAAPGSALQRLARQTAWIRHREAGPADAAVQALRALALEHPEWPQTIRNLSAVAPYEPALDRELETSGTGYPALLEWRFGALAARRGAVEDIVAAGLALAAAHGDDDPVRAGEVERRLAEYLAARGRPDCAGALLARADTRPGVKLFETPRPAVSACDLLDP